MTRILVVDDEPQLLEIIREHFQGRYEIDTALSGASAIERFVRNRPDMVFLDVNMPGANGVAVLKLLRETDPKIPVVIVTANAQNQVAAECLANGAFGYVPKPFNLTYMEKGAGVLLRGDAPFCPRARRPAYPVVCVMTSGERRCATWSGRACRAARRRT